MKLIKIVASTLNFIKNSIKYTFNWVKINLLNQKQNIRNNSNNKTVIDTDLGENIVIESPDVIFVGAGPIGLWTAIQLKLHEPTIKIQMFEKHKVYQRGHTLHIEKSSLKGAHPDKEFQDIIASFHGYIETNYLEHKLLNYAKKLGIAIEVQNITDCNKLNTCFPNVKFIIGSDGRQSLVRKQIFDDDLTFNYNLKYIAEVKYNIVGKGKSLVWLEILSTLAKCNHLVIERVGKERENLTTVSLRLFIDQKTFDSLDGATFKNPARLNADLKNKCPELYETIDTWISERKNYTNEVVSEDSYKITKVPLDIYKSNKVVKKDNEGISWLLVGDAAFGLPFFRALNDGLLNGSNLAMNISRQMHINHNDLSKSYSTPLDDYETHFNQLANYEKFSVTTKDIALTAGISKIGVSQKAYGMLSWAWNKICTIRSTICPDENNEQLTSEKDNINSKNKFYNHM